MARSFLPSLPPISSPSLDASQPSLTLSSPLSLSQPQATLPRLPTRISTQLRNILQHFSLVAGRELPIILARQNVDGSEIDFANMLTEDANNGELSYPDYLMIVHKQITVSLSVSSSFFSFSVSFDAILVRSSFDS